MNAWAEPPSQPTKLPHTHTLDATCICTPEPVDRWSATTVSLLREPSRPFCFPFSEQNTLHETVSRSDSTLWVHAAGGCRLLFSAIVLVLTRPFFCSHLEHAWVLNTQLNELSADVSDVVDSWAPAVRFLHWLLSTATGRWERCHNLPQGTTSLFLFFIISLFLFFSLLWFLLLFSSSSFFAKMESPFN